MKAPTIRAASIPLQRSPSVYRGARKGKPLLTGAPANTPVPLSRMLEPRQVKRSYRGQQYTPSTAKAVKQFPPLSV